MENKMEFRVQQINLSTEGEMMIVEGLVNKTDTWSETLGNVKRFKEKIVKGAFKNAISEATYIDFLAEHDKTKLLASTSNDSLELFEDEEGLKMRARIVPTAYGKDFYTLIKERIINHMSFGFSVLSQDFKKLADGTYERTVNKLRLFEVSAVRNPAYLASNISARGLDISEEIDIPDIEEEAEEERAIDTEILEGILNQLKANNELLSGLNIKNTGNKVDSIIQETAENTEVKEEVKEKEVVKETTSAELQKEKEEVVEAKVESIKEPAEIVKEPVCDEPVEAKEAKKTFDLSAQKQVLGEILKGEID